MCRSLRNIWVAYRVPMIAWLIISIGIVYFGYIVTLPANDKPSIWVSLASVVIAGCLMIILLGIRSRNP